MMPRPGTQALVVSRADKIAISALFASSLVRNIICVIYTKTIIHLSVDESDGYLPRRFAARQISTTIQLRFDEQLLNKYFRSLKI